MKRVIIGVLLGVVPGAIMVLLTVPLSGEVELTLGVSGTFLIIIGAIIGALVGARRRK